MKLALPAVSLGLVAAGLILFPNVVSGQGVGSPSACSGLTGVRITTVVGDGSAESAAPAVLAATDTLLVFDIAERKWTRTNFAARVDVGWASEDRRRFNVCAGVSIEMPEATLVIRGARGRVHFRASLDRLTLWGAGVAGTTSGSM